MPHSEIPREALTRYNQLIRGVSETANATLRGQMAASPPVTVTDLRKQLSTALRAADSAASEVDRQFYQGARRYVTGNVLRYINRDATHSWTEEYLDRALRNMVYEHGYYHSMSDTMEIDDPDAFQADLEQFVARMVNDGSKARMFDYGKRDPLKPRYARVPSGAETCAWCWALAGLGFQYKSAETASHSHAHCDCVVCPSWNESGVEGYDSEWYADKFRSVRVNTPSGAADFKATLAAMRKEYGLH